VTRALVVVSLLLVGCAEEGPTAPNLDTKSYPLPRLSDYRFFSDLPTQEPADGVIPYTVNAPLWADHADKGRYFILPEDGKITFSEQDEWSFPSGTVFIKSFVFGDRSVETRLLVAAEGGWEPHIYLWNDAQTDAEHIKAGADVTVDGQLYLVPDQNACETCHQRDDVVLILGPTTHQLNTTWEIEGSQVNQIDYLRDNDLFATAVPPAVELPAFPDPAGDAAIDERARAYLHGNCAHCHRPGGDGGASGLKFSFFVEEPADFGVCKLPAAAGAGAGGLEYDIVPGHPESSIIPFRMSSVDPEIKMPELPSLLADDFGVQLVSQWISEMPQDGC
jgi:uncharacterized repeat protein (TIGR03806 family)